jgi:hypothetical protein
MEEKEEKEEKEETERKDRPEKLALKRGGAWPAMWTSASESRTTIPTNSRRDCQADFISFVIYTKLHQPCPPGLQSPSCGNLSPASCVHSSIDFSSESR